MKIKSLAILGALSLSILPITSFADITITNNTNSPATAFAGNSPCSNAAGDRGVIQPHSQIVIADWIVGIYCTTDCKAEIFMTKNCSGKSIATVTANKKDGVKSTISHDDRADGYRIIGTGKSVSIEGNPQAERKWYQLFF
jgi:hypothetical protein